MIGNPVTFNVAEEQVPDLLFMMDYVRRHMPMTKKQETLASNIKSQIAPEVVKKAYDDSVKLLFGDG